MANVNLGKVALTPKGNWDNTIEYEKLDVVQYNGNSYIAKTGVPIGTSVTTGTNYWQLFSEKGNGISVGDVIIASTTQPTVFENKLWIREDHDEEYEVLTTEDIDDIAGDGDNNVIWSADKSYKELKTAVTSIIEGNATLYPNIISRKGIDGSDGTEKNISNDNWGTSDFILIPEGTVVIESNAKSGSGTYGYALYNTSKQYITGANNYDSFTIDMQSTYKYIRFTTTGTNGDFSAKYIIFHIKDKGISGLKDGIDIVANGEIIRSNLTMTSEKSINASNGKESSVTGYTNWQCSDFIEIPLDTIQMQTNAICTSNSYGLAFYGMKKNFISSVVSYNSPTVTILPTYKFVRITNNTNAMSAEVNVRFLVKNSLSRVGIVKENNVDFASIIKDASFVSGTYSLTTQVTLAKNQNIIGNNCVVNISDSGQIVMANGSKISGIKFVGDWNPAREEGDGETYTNYGYVPLITYQDLYNGDSDALFGENKTKDDAVIIIPQSNAYNVIIDSCRFENFNRLCIFAHGQRHQENTNPVICNNYFTDCRMGVYVRGEFERIYANEYLRCIVGCYLYGGNSNNYGEIFKCCDVGYYFPVDAVSHNEITAVECAHCGLAGIYIKYLNPRLGCIITGSHFPDAPIVGDDVNNLYISSCILSTWFKYNSGSGNAIVCSNVRKAYQYDKTTMFDVPSDTLITLNRGMYNTTDEEVNWS